MPMDRDPCAAGEEGLIIYVKRLSTDEAVAVTLQSVRGAKAEASRIGDNLPPPPQVVTDETSGYFCFGEFTPDWHATHEHLKAGARTQALRDAEDKGCNAAFAARHWGDENHLSFNRDQCPYWPCISFNG